MSNKPSIFTQIINREIPANIRYEDDEFIVFDDINPIAPVHVLVVPKKEIPTLEDTEPQDTEFIGKLFIIARRVAKQLGINDNYKFFMNVGKKVQMVHHIHLHLYGGWDKNKTTQELDKESQELINA